MNIEKQTFRSKVKEHQQYLDTFHSKTTSTPMQHVSIIRQWKLKKQNHVKLKAIMCVYTPYLNACVEKLDQVKLGVYDSCLQRYL